MDRAFMIDKGAVCERYIKPLVEQIYNICKEHDIPSVILIETERKELENDRTCVNYKFTATNVSGNPLITSVVGHIQSISESE